VRTARVPTEKLKEIRECLAKTASIEKRASELEHENDVLRRTLSLVSEGVLDSAVATEKIASFLDDIDTLRILELAATLDTGHNKLGSVADDDITAPLGDGSPEDKFRSDVEDIVSETGLSVI
jgi:hypothetical protein